MDQYLQKASLFIVVPQKFHSSHYKCPNQSTVTKKTGSTQERHCKKVQKQEAPIEILTMKTLFWWINLSTRYYCHFLPLIFALSACDYRRNKNAKIQSKVPSENTTTIESSIQPLTLASIQFSKLLAFTFIFTYSIIYGRAAPQILFQLVILCCH